MFGIDKQTENTGVHAGFTIGRVINVFLILIFLASLMSSLVVIGELDNLHRTILNDPKYKVDYINITNSSSSIQLPHFCALYSSFKSPPDTNRPNFTFSPEYSCEFVIAINGIVVIADAVLVVIAVIRIVWALNLHFTVFIEFGALFVVTVFAFIIGVTLSIGIDITCNSVGKFYSSSCVDRTFPFTNVGLYPVFNVTQAAMWFNFLFLFTLTIMFIARMVVYVKRQMRGGGKLGAAKEEYQPIIEEKNKENAMTRPV